MNIHATFVNVKNLFLHRDLNLDSRNTKAMDYASISILYSFARVFSDMIKATTKRLINIRVLPSLASPNID